MATIDNLLLGSSVSFIEEDVIDAAKIEELFEGGLALDHFVEKGILQYISKQKLKFTFVGAIVANKKVIHILPKYHKIYQGLTESSHNYYIKVIKKYVEYSARKSARKPVQEYLDDISLLMRTFDSLDGYYRRHGPFKERSSAFVKSDQGTINWAKTIQHITPVHVSGDPDGGIRRMTPTFETPSHVGMHVSATEAVFYPTPVNHVIHQNEGLVYRIFKTVLTLLASIIAPLLDRPHSLSLRMRQDSITSLFADLAEKQSFYARVVAQQIPKEFGQRRAALSSLLAFLRAEASILDGAIRNKAFAFGVKKFASIWEGACVHAVGGERGSYQLAKILWQPHRGINREYVSRIDAKLSSHEGSRVTLVDAKYNTLVSSESENDAFIEKMIPQHDVIKQFGYMLAYHLGTATDLECIDSVFIIPGSYDGTFSYLGQIFFKNVDFAEQAKLASIRPIGVYSINPMFLLEYYIKNERIVDFINYLATDHKFIEKTAVLTNKGVKFQVVMRKDVNGFRIIGSGGQSRIPWMNVTDINKAIKSANSKAAIHIFSEMKRNLYNKSLADFFTIDADVKIPNFETGTYILCGANQKFRRIARLVDRNPQGN